jgi:hypothetical protein
VNWPLAAGCGAVALSVLLLRRFALHRLAARQGRFAWLIVAPNLLYAIPMLWASIQLFASAPLVSLLMTIGVVIYVAVLVRLAIGLARSVTSPGSNADITTAMTEPVVNFTVTMVGLMLIGSLVAAVGLIIWGVSQAAQ